MESQTYLNFTDSVPVHKVTPGLRVKLHPELWAEVPVITVAEAEIRELSDLVGNKFMEITDTDGKRYFFGNPWHTALIFEEQDTLAEIAINKVVYGFCDETNRSYSDITYTSGEVHRNYCHHVDTD